MSRDGESANSVIGVVSLIAHAGDDVYTYLSAFV